MCAYQYCPSTVTTINSCSTKSRRSCLPHVNTNHYSPLAIKERGREGRREGGKEGGRERGKEGEERRGERGREGKERGREGRREGERKGGKEGGERRGEGGRERREGGRSLICLHVQVHHLLPVSSWADNSCS